MAELTRVPVTLAGHRAPRLPALRWLLLTCTLVGLAAMHTLGRIGPVTPWLYPSVPPSTGCRPRS